MHYDPAKRDHGLPHDPFKSCVIPRPIGWISTRGADGIDNLAPYSQFQNLTFDPPMVLFSANQTTDGRRKDSVVNAETTGQFVWNMATFALRDAVNRSAAEVPADVDEFALAGVTKAPSVKVVPPRVAESPIQFECEYLQTVRLPGGGTMGTVDVVFGRVVMVHIADDALTDDGRVDVLKIRPIARLGYYDYTAIDSTFQMVIPDANGALLRGLEGRAD
ncbi:MAG: flavin reductase family protein [Rhodobacterales bacterium]|nr:flavin reductase family protein [Rhodobacterales bacterium]